MIAKQCSTTFPCESKGLLIAHLNVQGLLSKIDQIHHLITTNSIKIMLCSETFISRHTPTSPINLTDYLTIRKDRPNRKGGGVLMFLHKTVNFSHLPHLENLLPEAIVIKVTPQHAKPFLLLNIYRPPNTKVQWFDQAYTLMQACLQECSETIAMGDFNLDYGVDSTKIPRKWSNICTEYNLNQLITLPTRLSVNRESILDHIYTTHPNNIINHGVVNVSLSDHFLIFAVRKTGRRKSNSPRPQPYGTETVLQTRRSWKHFNQSLFMEDLISAKACFQQITKYDEPEIMLQSFYNTFVPIVNTHIPIHRGSKQRKTKAVSHPWIDEEVRTLMKTRDFLKRAGNTSEYRAKRNQVTSTIRAKRKQHIRHLIHNSLKGDSRPLWNLMKNKTSNSKQILFINEQGSQNVLNNPKHIADEFNTYFQNVVSNLTKQREDEHEQDITHNSEQVSGKQNVLPVHSLASLSSDCRHEAEILPMDWTDTTNYIKGIKLNKAVGIDAISIKIIKIALPFIVNYLTSIFNQCIQLCVFPVTWKTSVITPIHKKGDTADTSNYRPISVLPILSKVLEKHLQTCTARFLKKNSLLSNSQSGFRSGHSCTTALTKMHCDWTGNKSRKKYTCIVLLDFSKAFDTIDHDILLDKLRRLNFNSSFIKMIASFLKDRIQYVKIGNHLSRQYTPTHGVPQGSILGPLLFSIYINDLLSLPISSTIHSYADDTTLYYADYDLHSIQNTIAVDLSIIKDWCTNNKMFLNIKKCSYLLISPRSEIISGEEFHLAVESAQISRVHSTALLGFYIRDDLRWDDHLAHLHKKARTNLNLLRFLRADLDRCTSVLFYNAFILPHISHGIHIWACTSKKSLITSIETLQRSAIRAIHRVSLCDKIRSSTLASSLRILTIPQLHLYYSASLAHKIYHNTSPSYLSDMFHVSGTRKSNRKKAILPSLYHHTKLHASLISSFNALPLSLKHITFAPAFNTSLKRFILSNG